MLIYPYRKGSKSVRALRTTVPAKTIKLDGSKFRGRPTKVVLNWGANDITNAEVMKCTVINKPAIISRATNKLSFFSLLDDKLTVPWTEDRRAAEEWAGEGELVVARTMLRAHSGEGIVLVGKGEALPVAPLYTKYMKKQEEFRVHVFLGNVIDVQRKARKLETPDDQVDWRIRTHHHGFIYAREGVEALPYHRRLCEVATEVVSQLGLDFGAVDLIYNAKKDAIYALEVNTAPGLEGTTLTAYVSAIREYERGRRVDRRGPTHSPAMAFPPRSERKKGAKLASF